MIKFIINLLEHEELVKNALLSYDEYEYDISNYSLSVNGSNIWYY